MLRSVYVQSKALSKNSEVTRSVERVNFGHLVVQLHRRVQVAVNPRQLLISPQYVRETVLAMHRPLRSTDDR